MGNKKNFSTRIYVARIISGMTPCVAKPFKPCLAWKSLMSSTVPF